MELQHRRDDSLGALVGAAVKRSLSGYLSEKIWSRFGMEAEATWWLESPDGLEIGGSGFSATLRDYGRFAQFVLNGGKAGGQQVVPTGWFGEAGTPEKIGGGLMDYGYMWWTLGPGTGAIHQGAFYALGIFGQFVYISPKHNVAIVVWSARQKPPGSTMVSDVDFFGAVTAALRY
jgi:CubicO group peptidase (beta-lactamase class C family)